MKKRPSLKLKGKYDAAGFDVPVGEPPTIAELLEHGTAQEVRGALGSIGIILQNEGSIGPETSRWIGAALLRIGDGERADVALRLNTKKRYGVHWARAVKHMVETAQGVTQEEALIFAGQYDPNTNDLRPEVTDKLNPESTAELPERVKKRLQRATGIAPTE